MAIALQMNKGNLRIFPYTHRKTYHTFGEDQPLVNITRRLFLVKRLTVIWIEGLGPRNDTILLLHPERGRLSFARIITERNVPLGHLEPYQC